MAVAEHTSGECHTCKLLYRWPRPPLLRDAVCTRCLVPLAHRNGRRAIEYTLATERPAVLEANHGV